MNVFDQAHGVIHDRGMCKFELEDNDGHVCLNGALNVAFTGSATCWGVMAEQRAERAHLCRVAHGLFPDRILNHYQEPSHVNNHPDTTQEDVELILKHAAYEWDEQGLISVP